MTLRTVQPDKKRAASMIEAAEREMDYVVHQAMKAEAAATLVRAMYECFRMVGDALLLARGFEAKDHHVMIDEVLHMDVETPQPLVVLDRLRRTRMKINYEGYFPTKEELDDFHSFSRACWQPVLTAAKKRLE